MSIVSIIIISIFLIVLVAMSAFFSSSEIAYASANWRRLSLSADCSSKRAKRAVFISENFTRFLSTVLVGNNLVNIAFSSALAVIAVEYLDMSADVSSLIATAILLVFGEILPKIAGKYMADSLVKPYSGPLRVTMFVFSPFIKLISLFVDRLSVSWTPKDTEPEVTDEELVTLLETIEDEGVFTQKEGELIKSAIEFPDVTALEIFIPRVDVDAFDIEDDINELINDPDLMSYSRIPVYRETIDNIIGILPTKRLMKAKIADPKAVIDIIPLLTPAVFVHKTRNISSILMEFKRKQLQMAVVVDEYGGTMGILTLEDILEEIVGDIFDESDEIENEVEVDKESCYIVDGTMTITNFFEFVGYEHKDFNSKYTTVGGWAIEILDRFPEVGDTFIYDIFTVEVLEAESMRVEKLKITVNHPADLEESG